MQRYLALACARAKYYVCTSKMETPGREKVYMTHEDMYDTPSLERVIEDRLFGYAPLRTTGILVRYEVKSGGVVRLTGPVPTRVIADEVIALVQAIPGVQRVESAIMPDPDLELIVAGEVAEDVRTQSIQPGHVFMRSHNGALTLFGRLSEPGARDDLVAVASSVEGVRSVIDKMVV